jgi:opacity protein-like surface antigen
MKKIKTLLFLMSGFVLCLCLAATVKAATVGSPETQGKGNFAVQVFQEFGWDRDMKYDGGGSVALGDMKDGNMFRTISRISYGLFDDLDFYVDLGLADVEGRSADFKSKTDTGFVWGLGLKKTCELSENWFAGVNAEYLHHKHDARISWGGYKWEATSTFQEWHVAPFLAVRTGRLVPYVGLKYSDFRAEVDNAKFKADNNFGMFVGTDCKITDNFSVNVEGRFIDETALSIACSYKF